MIDHSFFDVCEFAYMEMLHALNQGWCSLAAAWLLSQVRSAMGGSWKEVMEVLVEGIVVQVVGSVVVLLLWDSIAKWRHRHNPAHPLLLLSLSSGDCLSTCFDLLHPVCHTVLWTVAYSCLTAVLRKNFIVSELCAKKRSSKLTPKVLWWFQAQNCLKTPLLKASYSF
jgi:hypothetical protein